MSVTVKYKGSAIAELTENGTKTLKTSGKYCEADIVVENTKDGGTQVTDGIVVKARDANGKPTAADFYISVLDANLLGEPDGRHRYWLTELTTANFINPITDIKQYGLCLNSKLTGSYTFYVNGLNQKTIYQCSALEGLSLPECASVAAQCVQNMSSLKTLYMPKCTSYGNVENSYAPFVKCTALETVQLGSIGYSVGVLGKVSSGVMKSFVFNGCTQSGLTITLYCKGAEADTLLSNVRGNATNATIIIKASESTTYNDVNYSAGDTMITSEVA